MVADACGFTTHGWRSICEPEPSLRFRALFPETLVSLHKVHIVTAVLVRLFVQHVDSGASTACRALYVGRGCVGPVLKLLITNVVPAIGNAFNSSPPRQSMHVSSPSVNLQTPT